MPYDAFIGLLGSLLPPRQQYTVPRYRTTNKRSLQHSAGPRRPFYAIGDGVRQAKEGLEHEAVVEADTFPGQESVMDEEHMTQTRTNWCEGAAGAQHYRQTAHLKIRL